MASARVTAIAQGITLQAKDVNGNLRDLALNGEILDGERIIARSPGPQYLLTAYTLQRRSAGNWVDSLTVSLNARDGTSHFREDKFGVMGDANDSSVYLLLTVAKGCRQTAHDLSVLQVMQTDVGGQFSYPPGSRTFKGCFSALDRTSDLEMGGFQEGIDAQIVSDLEQWAAVPAAPVVGQDLLWHDGRTKYRVVKVDVDEISYVIGVASVNR